MSLRRPMSGLSLCAVLPFLFAGVSLAAGPCPSAGFTTKFFPAPNAFVSSLAVGDFNEDGHDDVLLGAGSLFVMAGDGRGSFTPSIDVGDTAGDPASIAVADLNGDGHLDAAIANRTAATDGSVSILLGTGAGTFRSRTDYALSRTPRAIVAADLNGDGKTDLAIATSFSGGVQTLLNSGDGSFSRGATAFGAGNFNLAIESADFNVDGKNDLVIANLLPPYISVFLNRGAAQFDAPIALDPGERPGTFGDSVAVADFDGDQRSDIAVAVSSTGVEIFISKGDGTFARGFSAAARGADTVAAADLNNDGRTDLAVADREHVRVFLATANGFIAADAAPLRAGNVLTIVAGDFDGDDARDLVVLDGFPAGVWLLLNDCPASIPTLSVGVLVGLALTLCLVGATFNVT